MTYDASSCWHCGAVFNRPHSAFRVGPCPQTNYHIYAFCGWECALAWMAEAYASSKRSKLLNHASVPPHYEATWGRRGEGQLGRPIIFDINALKQMSNFILQTEAVRRWLR